MIEEPNRVFVLGDSSRIDDLLGVAGADELCNIEALAAGLPHEGQYVAWLSTRAEDAIDRLAGSRGWVRTDLRPFADTPADLARGVNFYPIILDAFGNPVDYGPVLTGTTGEGRLALDENCDDLADSSSMGTFGATQAGGTSWTDSYAAPCTASFLLFCFGTGQSVPVAPDPPAGKIAFITRGATTGMAGTAGLDTLCNDEAGAAGLTGTFVALVGTTTMSIADRLGTTEGPWSRPDGVVVAQQLSDLDDGLEAPVLVTADGFLYRDHPVWAGVNGTDVYGTTEATCDDWSRYEGVGRSAASSNIRPLGTGAGYSCVTRLPVLCFQQ